MASGSACEVEYHLILARDLALIVTTTYDQLNNDINEIKRMLCGLTHYLENELQVSRAPAKTPQLTIPTKD